MFCQKCGNELSEDTQFCPNCGFSIESIGHKRNLLAIIRKYRGILFSVKKIKKLTLYKIVAFSVLVLFAVFMYVQYNAVRQAEMNAADSAKIAAQAETELTKTKQQAMQEAASDQSKIQALLSKNTNKTSITDIVDKWSPIIAYVACEYTDAYGSTQRQSGSGTLIINKDETRSILTNYHVVSDTNGYIVSDCSVKLPNDDITYTAYTNDITTTSDTADVAYISIKTPDAYLQNMTTQGRNYCTQIPSLGDEIVVLGYPGIGSQTSITATDGIIAGYDNNYYVTSAKVAHGNSGGAAIDVARNCYLGIPTYVETDTAESLARILKWQGF